MNTIQLIARLTKDPEVRTTTTTTTVCSMRVAVNRTGTDGVDYVDVTAFGKLASVCGEYLAKGRRVAITGRLRYSEWSTEAGPRSKHEVVANLVEFLDGPRTEERTEADGTEPF
jgi:single-strand DNA-binding protein